MTQIANNFITLPRTRSRRSKSRWAYIGAAAAVCGILSVYGLSKAHAQIDMPTLCEDIFLNMELSLAHHEKQGRRVGATKLETLKPRLIELANENRMGAADWAVIYQAKCK